MALNKDNIKTLIGSALVGFHNNILKNKLVPAGGTTGQVLSKTSDTDNDVEWTTLEDTNKYKLITCDDPLVINKSDITDITDITDIADATVTIDNLTGQYGNLVANEDGTWTYTLNGFMNGLETFTFTVGETTQDLVIVPYKEMVYNDNNAGIEYNGTWDVENNTKYSNGSAHYSSEANAKATFRFTGTEVDVYSRTTATDGRIIAKLSKVEKDGTTENLVSKQVQIIDNQSASGNYYQIPTLNFDTSKYGGYGTYEVEITVAPITSENRVVYYLDGIRVYNPLNITNLKINDLYRLEEKQNNFLHIDRKNAKYSPTHNYDPATKVYVDDSIPKEDTENETLNKLLEYGLVSDALMLDDGTYLTDENDKLLQI